MIIKDNNPSLQSDNSIQLQPICQPVENAKVIYENDLNAELTNSIGATVFAKYREAVLETQTAKPTEVVINSKSNLYTNDALNELVDHVKNNEAMTTTAAIPVTYDIGTNKVTKKADAQLMKYDISYYNETPSYVGASQNGQQQILRYNMAKKEDGEIRGIIAADIYGSNTIENRKKVGKGQIKKFRLDNPEELFLAIEGTSTNIEYQANKTFTELASAAITLGQDDAYSIAANSFAQLSLTASPERRVSYGRMATSLKNMVLQKNDKRKISQPPAYWNDNKDGTFSGHKIDYRYDKDKKIIVADISMLTYGKGITNLEGQGGIENTKVTSVTTVDMSQLNTAHVYALDILYGTGNEIDMPKSDETNSMFVPAWYNSEFASNYSK
jgi:hypothetical protein